MPQFLESLQNRLNGLGYYIAKNDPSIGTRIQTFIDNEMYLEADEAIEEIEAFLEGVF